MDTNRLKILITLAAALTLAGCDAAPEKAGRDRASAVSNANSRSPAPAAAALSNAATANTPAPSNPTSAGASQVNAAGAAKGASAAAVPTPRIGSGGNDFFLFTQARAAINSDAELRAANLTLDVREGVATLTGTVANAALKSKAEELVQGAGPRTVRNQLRVSAGN